MSLFFTETPPFDLGQRVVSKVKTCPSGEFFKYRYSLCCPVLIPLFCGDPIVIKRGHGVLKFVLPRALPKDTHPLSAGVVVLQPLGKNVG